MLEDQERPISWLERLKIACCETSEVGYATDDNDEIDFKNRSDAALSGLRQRPPLVRGVGKGARGGGPLCPEKVERATFPATLALPKSRPMLEHTVTLEHDYAEGVDLNLHSARTDVTMASPFPEAAPSAVWDTIPVSEEKVGRACSSSARTTSGYIHTCTSMISIWTIVLIVLILKQSS